MFWRVVYAVAFVTWNAVVYGEDIAHGAVPSPLLALADHVTTEPDEELGMRGGHYAGVVEFPNDALLLRIHLIRAARRTIDLQTFIWDNDASSKLVAYELVQAAKRGVKVRVLMDHMWSAKNTPEITFDETTYPGMEIKIYRPPAKWLNPGTPWRMLYMILPTGANQRMHSKMMVVDDVVAFTGGRNIGDKYFALSTEYNFKDREVLVIGPQVREMLRSFQEFWDFKKSYFNYDLRDVASQVKEGVTQPEVTRADVALDTTFAKVDHDANDPEAIQKAFVDRMVPVASLRFVGDAPGKKADFAYTAIDTRSKMFHAFWAAVYAAHSEVLMQSPYTIFDYRARHLFREHREDVPEMRAMISTNSLGAADHVVTYSANFRLRTKLIRGLKCEVYEMKPHPEILPEHLPGFDDLKRRAEEEKKSLEPYLSIHAKTYIFDAHTVYIGTMNLDPRSFYVNSECGIFIEDDAFATQMRTTLLREMNAENSWVIAKNQYIFGFFNRILEGISSMLPIDPWPIRNTSGYELKEGAKEVPPTDPAFYDNYKSIGSFPGTDNMDQRRIVTSIYKIFGMAATPLL